MNLIDNTLEMLKKISGRPVKQNVNQLNPRKIVPINEEIKVKDNQTAIFS